MTISDEAVEAAAKALWDIDREHNDREYEDCREGTRRHLRREARAALEAAAPFIRAQALEDAAADFTERVAVTRQMTTGNSEYGQKVLHEASGMGRAAVALRARAAAERGGA